MGRAVFLAAIMVISVVAMSAAFAGAAAAQDQENLDPSDDNLEIWHGQVVTFDLSDEGDFESTTISLEKGIPGNSETVKFVDVDSAGITDPIDTAELEAGEPHFFQSGDDATSTFRVHEQEVEFEFDPGQVIEGQDDTDLMFEDDNRGDAVDLLISSDDLDLDDLQDVFADYDDYDEDDGYVVIEGVSEGEAVGATTSDLDLGTYNVTVDIADTTASDDATFEVVEEVDGMVSMMDAEQEVGDVLVGTFELHEADSIDRIYLSISDEYYADLNIDVSEVEEDGEVMLYWNTYKAGSGVQAAANGDHPAFWAEAADEDVGALDVTVEDERNIGDAILPTTLYEVNVYSDDPDRLNRDDVGSYVISDRHTGDMANHIAPAGTDLDDILGAVTLHDDVADGDLLVQEIEVSGIFGQAYDGHELDSDALVDGEQILLNYTSQYDPTFDPTDEFDHEMVEFLADEENNTLYAVLDTSEIDTMNEESLENPWDTEFTVVEGYMNADDDEVAETSFSVVEPVFELDPFYGEPYYMTPDENAEIRGSTTLAPGTEADLTIRKPGVFNHPNEVEVVEDDGDFVWSHQADYSDRAVGDEFTIISDDFMSTAHGEEVAGEFAEEAEWDAVDEEAVLLQEIRDLLGVEDDDEIKGAIEALMDERDDLEAQLDDANAEIDDLNNQIADLNDEIDDLNNQIDELEADDNGDDNGDDDDDGTPGFGVAVALVALLSAAMLALRRRD